MLTWREGHGSWVPPADIYESDDCWTVFMELPGVTLDQLDITVTGDLLQVSGRKALPEGGSTALRLEIPTGTFVREMRFSGGIDIEGVTAAMDLGLLSVRLPKIGRGRIRIHVEGPAAGTAPESDGG